jgi:hypothetical protein
MTYTLAFTVILLSVKPAIEFAFLELDRQTILSDNARKPTLITENEQ